MIGGNVCWASKDSVTGSAVRKMASRAARGRAHLYAEQGPVGLFSSIQTDRLESNDDVWVVADLDVTNLDELHRIVGVDRGPEGLLAALYRLQGPAFLQRLRGAFALGLWDARAHTLLLAVDRFGLKRLHYTTDGQRVAFASRATALLAAPGVDGRVDPAAIYQYLNCGYVRAPTSIFRGIARLEPGQFLLVRPGRVAFDRYGDVLGASERPLGDAEAMTGLYGMTEESVRTALTGCVPKATGAVLSGGPDGTAIVGLMTRITGEPVNTFSIGFREDRYDAMASAERAARHFRANHYTHILTADEALALVPQVVESYDEPFGDDAALASFRCAELARDCGVTRLLVGEGGEEVFGVARAASAGGQPAGAWRNAASGGGESDRCFFAREGQQLLSPDFRATVAGETPPNILDAHYTRTYTAAELNRLLYLDVKLAIPDIDLLKVTRTAEVAGVAVRFPLLGSALVDFTATLPMRYKANALERRSLFNQAFRELLPLASLTTLPQRGDVPTGVWLNDHAAFREFARDVLLSTRAQQRGYFRRGALEQVFDDHAADTKASYGDVLWTVLMLELWHRRHLEATHEL